MKKQRNWIEVLITKNDVIKETQQLFVVLMFFVLMGSFGLAIFGVAFSINLIHYLRPLGDDAVSALLCMSSASIWIGTALKLLWSFEEWVDDLDYEMTKNQEI